MGCAQTQTLLLEAVRRRADDATEAFRFARWDGRAIVIEPWSGAGILHAARNAAGIIAARTLPGARVLIAFPPGPDFVAAFLGAVLAGRIAAPVQAPTLRRAREAFVRVAHQCAATLALGRTADLAELGIAHADLSESAPPFSQSAGHGQDIAYLQFTSGSTREPMGAIITHRALDANLRAIQETWSLTSADRGVFWLPPFHDMGLVGAILAPFVCGFPVVLMHPTAFLQRPMRWLELIAETRATITGAPNFAYDLCVERLEANHAVHDLSCLRVAINGAEPVRKRTLEAFTERFAPHGFSPRAFAPGYGLAEAVLFVSASQSGAEAFAEPPACGSPHTGLDLRIVDPETHEERPEGETGEIWIAGEGVARGYWNAREASETAFAARLPAAPNAGPFLRTGDLGFLRGGALHVAGRIKELIIQAGRNHFAADLEACIRQALACPAALRTAALAVELGGDEQLVILQEIARGQDARPVLTAIANALGQEDLLAHRIVLLPPGALPITTSGKIARSRAAERLAANALPILAEHVAAQPRAREI